jgi:23S rRNA (pseudouridine1915-N3)-methyltransferase
MKLWLITVGRSGRVLEPAIEEYETRARRYWPVEVIEVERGEGRGGLTDDAVRDAEADACCDRVPKGAELVALTARGTHGARSVCRATFSAAPFTRFPESRS